MKFSAIVGVVAAAWLTFGSVSSFAQGSGPDRNNEPQIYNRSQSQNDTQMYNGVPGPGYLGNRNLRNDRDRNDRVDRSERNERRPVTRNDMTTPPDQHGGRGWYRGGDRRYDHRDESRNWDQNRFYYGARGPEFRRGGYIPYEFRNRQYFVNDWGGHYLPAPPYGYQWVQVGGDYVLISLATGQIANLILIQ